MKIALLLIALVGCLLMIKAITSARKWGAGQRSGNEGYVQHGSDGSEAVMMSTLSIDGSGDAGGCDGGSGDGGGGCD